ncbi:MAG: monooxygenase [Rugosibacter sp.]|nr:MAG: monooxygenase [Rugosibacter sp.]
MNDSLADQSQRKATDVPVLIIGGGPVGLTLAMDLASRGVETLLVEQRAASEPPDPRCNHVAARSMEVFRRLGVAGKVRDTGLPADYPHDVAYATSLFGYELGRVRIPSRANRFNDEGYADGGWPTPEPPHRINQFYLEPVLFQHATTFDKLTIISNFRADGITHLDGAVRVSGTDLTTGNTLAFDARFVAGCDGARSMVRRTLGIKLQGDDNLMHAMMATITAPDLLKKTGCSPAWMYWIINPRQTGAIVALDGKDEWVVNAFFSEKPDEASFDWDTAVRACIGDDIDFTIHSKKPWGGRRLLAEKFSSDNIFILGDAAHNWLPMAGYGMNAGIADAANLAWKLAAVINGWADESLLRTYESERRPILDQVSAIAMQIRKRNDVAVPPEIEEASEKGRAVREKIGRYMVETDGPQFACIGLNFGYFYEDSPIIAYDSGKPPTYTMGTYTPSTCPGCRTPHIWLDDGTSLYDRLGQGYSLLRCDRSIDIGALERAARAANLPLEIIDLEGNTAASVYDVPLVLVRPDQHVAWRGTVLPSDPGRLIDHVRGTSLLCRSS